MRFTDDLLPDCPKPVDRTRVEKNRKRFFDLKNKNGSNFKRPPFKRINGKPMKLNKKGVYVLDQKQNHQEVRKAMLARQRGNRAHHASLPPPASTAPPRQVPEQTPNGAIGGQPNLAHVTQVRDALRQLL